jgi:hypothetical protein
MSLLSPHERLFLCLAGRIADTRLEYCSKDQAYERLKNLTGQDFGNDLEKWKQWLTRNGLLRLPRQQIDDDSPSAES